MRADARVYRLQPTVYSQQRGVGLGLRRAPRASTYSHSYVLALQCLSMNSRCEGM